MIRWRPWFIYGALAVVIMGPLLLPGYILTIDMPWTPWLPEQTPGDSSWLFFTLLGWLGIVIPSMILQKLLLLAIFIVAGVGAYKLAQDRVGQWPAYFAGVVYVVNPFVYTRLVAGQYLILLGYALLPWFALALVKLLERPGWKRALYLAAWGFGVATVAIHDIGLIALLALVIVLAASWRHWPVLLGSAKWLALAFVSWLALCAIWLVPLVMGRSSTAQQIGEFSWNQFGGYITAGEQAWVPLNTLALQGFWIDTAGKYALPSATGVLFWLAFALIAALVGLGIWRCVTRRDRLGIALVIAGLIAWILAMGIAWPPVAPITRWLVEYVPFYRGYREPQKWLALLALAYAYLGAVGLSVIHERLKGWRQDVAVLLVCLLPLLWVPMLLWGAAGQLRSVEYPASWYELGRRLDSQPGQFKVLMFPWHQYIALDFAGRTVANPAPAFIGRPVISSHDPELPGVAAPRPADNIVIEDEVLTERFYARNAGSKLEPLGVRYIVLLKQSDWRLYKWLDRQEDLKLVEQTDGWKLYQVEVAK